MASIYFKHLVMDNFMSYQHAELDLNRDGNILVGGINNNPDDNAKSNGCGKSGLFSALSWCLTGETVNGAIDVANIYLDGKTEVSITFTMDGSEYEITRSKNPSKLYIKINGEDKSGKGIRDTSKLLEEYLPQLTSNLLNSVIILGQGLPQKFTSNTPSGRKDVLEKLSNSDFMIADIKDKLSIRGKALSESKRRLEDNILENEATTRALEAQLKSLESELDNVPDINKLNEDKTIYETKLDKLEDAIKEDQQNLLKLEADKEEASKERESIQNKYSEGLDNLILEDVDGMMQDFANLAGKITILKKNISDLDNVVDICPTCGQKLPDVNKIDTTEKKNELDKLIKEKSEVENKLNKAKKNNSEIVQEYKDAHSKAVDDATKIESEILSNIKSIRIKIENSSSEKSNIQTSLAKIEAQISSLEETIKSLNDKIKTTEDDIKLKKEQLYNYNEELNITKDRVNINSKMMTLAKRDFRGYLLQNIISFIETKAKSYSEDVFGTDKLVFELSGNNIDISYDGKDYSCLSGGEKQKLDVIIQFAIRDMLCTFLNFSSNILILDEITDALDSIGVSKVFNLIGSSLQDVEAVYIISHHVDELEIPADDEIMIIKGDDKISRIV